MSILIFNIAFWYGVRHTLLTLGAYSLIAKRHCHSYQQEGLWRSHWSTIKNLMILKLEDIYSLHLGKFKFSLKNTSIAFSFSRSILRINQVHGYNTRSSKRFYIHFVPAVPAWESFVFSIKVLSSLASWLLSFCDAPSLYSFQSRVKKTFSFLLINS